jgi:hypothetical protein
MRPRDAWIVSLVRPFRFECVRDAGRVPSNMIPHGLFLTCKHYKQRVLGRPGTQ